MSVMNRTARGGTGEQRRLTPAGLASALGDYWPYLAMDPAGAPGSLVACDRTCYPEHDDPGLRDGLAIDWPALTYVNPPFKTLKKWLAKAAECPECIMLAPWRPHRKWFRAAMAKSSAHVALNPIAFHGFDNVLPLACTLIYWGPDPVGFLHHFQGHGSPHLGPLYREES